MPMTPHQRNHVKKSVLKPQKAFLGVSIPPQELARLKAKGIDLGMLQSALARRLIIEGLDIIERSGGLTPGQVMQVST
jgi:hypothetical protein